MINELLSLDVSKEEMKLWARDYCLATSFSRTLLPTHLFLACWHLELKAWTVSATNLEVKRK